MSNDNTHGASLPPLPEPEGIGYYREVVSAAGTKHVYRQEPSFTAEQMRAYALAALPAEKPAAAAERGAVGQWERSADGRHLYSNSFSHDVKLTLDGDWETPSQRIGYAVNLLSILNATPPAQAAELPPLPEAANDNRKFGRAGFYENPSAAYTADQMRDYARAALTQRPAAPLATDAGVENERAAKKLRDLGYHYQAGSWGFVGSDPERRKHLGTIIERLADLTKLHAIQAKGYDEREFIEREPVMSAVQAISTAAYALHAAPARPAAERPAQGEAGVLNRESMEVGGLYNWKGQPERLTYLGRNWRGNGYWNQFALVAEPGKVWCEVIDSELVHFEKTAPRAPEGGRNDTEQA